MIKKIILICLLFVQFLIVNSLYAANPESFGFITVQYRDPNFNIYSNGSGEVVKSTLQNILLRSVGTNKIAFYDISKNVKEIQAAEKEISLEPKDVPVFMDKLKKPLLDYYMVGYVNSVSTKNSTTHAWLPIKFLPTFGSDAADVVQVDLSIAVFSGKSKKMVFMATGRGSSDKHNTQTFAATKNNIHNVNTEVKSVMEEQIYNALQKASINAANKIAKAI